MRMNECTYCMFIIAVYYACVCINVLPHHIFSPTTMYPSAHSEKLSGYVDNSELNNSGSSFPGVPENLTGEDRGFLAGPSRAHNSASSPLDTYGGYSHQNNSYDMRRTQVCDYQFF